MSKRYYIVPIVQYVNEDGFEAYRAKVPQGMSFVAEIPTGPDGRPTSSWALVLVSAIDHLPLLEDPEIDPLPDFPKDAKVSAMHQATKQAMRAALVRRGVGGGSADNADGYRDVLRAIGRRLNPDFHEDRFDVSE
jgi:hypothetical protein